MLLGPEILSICVSALTAEEEFWLVEQASRVLDSLDEVDLHGVLAGAFAASGLGVVREQAFPSEWRKKKARKRELPNDAQRQRCDLVLLASGAQRLRDPLAGERTTRSERAAARGTLYEALALEGADERSGWRRGAARSGGGVGLVDAEEAYWLEVKTVGQFCYTLGVPGANATYSSQLVRGIAGDLRKLADDSAIRKGGVLLVLFTSDATVAEHDTGVLMHKCLDRNLPIRSALCESFSLSDRIGNGCCRCVLIELAST